MAKPTYIQPTFTRQGNASAPMTARFPRIIGGVCEKCGVIDSNQASEVQYTLCPHFRNMGLVRCEYCDPSKDPMEVIRVANMNVAFSPNSTAENPKVMAWCNSLKCADAHLARYDMTRK